MIGYAGVELLAKQIERCIRCATVRLLIHRDSGVVCVLTVACIIYTNPCNVIWYVTSVVCSVCSAFCCLHIVKCVLHSLLYVVLYVRTVPLSRSVLCVYCVRCSVGNT